MPNFTRLSPNCVVAKIRKIVICFDCIFRPFCYFSGTFLSKIEENIFLSTYKENFIYINILICFFYILSMENNLILRTFFRNLKMQVLDWLRFETSFQAMSLYTLLYTKTKPWSLLSTENFFFLEGDERPTKKSRRNELKVKEEENVNSHKKHLPTVLVTKLVFKKIPNLKVRNMNFWQLWFISSFENTFLNFEVKIYWFYRGKIFYDRF